MKSAKYASFFAGTLFFASGVLAGPVNKKPLHLYESVVVEGKQLPPGDYKVEWSEPGPEVQVSIVQGKETVATVSAREVPLNSTVPDSYGTRAAQDGSKTLTQLFFGGKKYELEIGGGSAGAASQAAASQQN